MQTISEIISGSENIEIVLKENTEVLYKGLLYDIPNKYRYTDIKLIGYDTGNRCNSIVI